MIDSWCIKSPAHALDIFDGDCSVWSCVGRRADLAVGSRHRSYSSERVKFLLRRRQASRTRIPVVECRAHLGVTGPHPFRLEGLPSLNIVGGGSVRHCVVGIYPAPPSRDEPTEPVV